MNLTWFRFLLYESRQLKIKIFQKSIVFLIRVFRNFKPLKKNIELLSIGCPKMGKKLTDGQYIFAGVQFEIDVDNPWLIEIPSPEVEQNLHGFCWLNELRAFGTSKARALSELWIDKWYLYSSSGKQLGWNAEIVAVRCVNLIRNWKFLTSGSSKCGKTTNLFLWQQLKFLKLMVYFYPNGLVKLKMLYAIFLLTLVFSLSRNKLSTLLDPQ